MATGTIQGIITLLLQSKKEHKSMVQHVISQFSTARTVGLSWSKECSSDFNRPP